MKIQVKAVLMLMTAFVVLNFGCKKNEITNSPFDGPATDAFNADVQNAQLIKLGAVVP